MTRKISVHHELTRDEALGRVKTALADEVRRAGDKVADLRERWDGSSGRISFKALGFGVAADVAVSDDEVSICLELPWTAALFAGRLEDGVRQTLERILS